MTAELDGESEYPREFWIREPGGASACSILANADRPFGRPGTAPGPDCRILATWKCGRCRELPTDWWGSLLMSRVSGGEVMQIELVDSQGVEHLHSLR
jgi:hypothetical protein